jgi:hypothetical protein
MEKMKSELNRGRKYTISAAGTSINGVTMETPKDDWQTKGSRQNERIRSVSQMSISREARRAGEVSEGQHARVPPINSMVVNKHRLDLDASDKLFAIEPTIVYAKVHERLIRCHIAEQRIEEEVVS